MSELVEGPRILHVVPRVVRRGAEVFAAQLADALQPVSQNLLFPLFGPAEGTPAAPVRVVGGARRAGVIEQRTGVDPGALARMRAGVHRLRPDLVVAHGGEPLKYAVLADPRGRVPLAYRKISHTVDGRGQRGLRALLSRPQVVLAVSEGLKRELVESYGVDSRRVVVIPTSRRALPRLTEAERRKTRMAIGAHPERPLLAWAGRLSREKRPDHALRVFALVRSRLGPCGLALCGSGPLGRPIEAAAVAAGPGLLMLGSRDDADRIIASADLLLSTSEIEGAPGVLVEAGLSGVPAVAFDVGEVREIVRDGETGILIPPGDIEMMADAATKLIQDADRRTEMGRSAREACAPRRLETAVVRYADTFADLLGPRGQTLRRLGESSVS